MVTKEEAKEKVKELVEEFSKYSKEELDNKSEPQIQAEFIDELFSALGWDMRKDVEREARVLKGRADYIFKIGNTESLVVEAKKTNVQLLEEQGRQAVSYAYHRKIKFSVLTNFKYLRVFHALSNIKNIDKNLLFWLEFKDFEKEFDKLWILSRESFEKQEINKLLSKKDEQRYKPIDESILRDLLEFRELLSKDLKNKRTYLSPEQIDEAVQILIDRLIFMRSVEDRGLEAGDFLLKIINGWEKGFTDKNLWALLKAQFTRFDKTYNSKLFFEGLLEKDDVYFEGKILSKIIKGLYYGTQDHQERYMFDEIPVDLLGSIYEQYLGVVLRGTEKRVRLDLQSGKRKRMGIYYTPSYIVDYIVKNTVGEYIKDKSIDEILEVKILDPACGSGSFLTRAFQEVCNVIEDKLKKGEKSKKWGSFNKINGRLNLSQKATILLNCIYGVDLDEKAVELAQLNFLLKILEEETRETKKRILPNMKDNIKCGNSLIDDSKFDKAFNWNAQFPDVFQDGGFDIVVGNPPYVFGGSSGITQKEKNFFKKTYDSAKRKLNLFSLFIEKSLTILKDKGLFSFILPNTLLRVTSYEDVRKLILERTRINQIVDLSSGVFEGVTASTIIIILAKEKDINKIRTNEVKISYGISKEFNLKPQEEFHRKLFIFDLSSDERENKIIKKMKRDSIRLGDICKEMIFGVVITKNKKEVVSNKKIDNRYKRFLEGKDIGRYLIKFSNKYLLYEKSKLHRSRTPDIFEANEKILVQRISGGKKPLKAAYDSEQYYNKESINNIILKDNKYNLKFILALINSSIINWYYSTKFTNISNLTVNISKAYLSEIPIKFPSPQQEQKIVSLVEQMLELQKKIHDEKVSGNEKERFEQQIKNIDYEIDEEGYKLYGLTPEEIKIIKESLK